MTVEDVAALIHVPGVDDDDTRSVPAAEWFRGPALYQPLEGSHVRQALDSRTTGPRAGLVARSTAASTSS